MNKIKESLKNGVSASIYAAMTQGLHGVILTLVALITINGLTSNVIVGGVAVSAIVEFTMVFFAFAIYYIKSQMKRINGKTFINFVKTKEGMFVFLSGVIGGAIGTTFLTLGIQAAGESYGIVLSALFPAITAIASHWLFKEKIKTLGWVALSGVAISAVLLTIIPSIQSGEKLDIAGIVGILYGLLAGIGWTTEALIVSKVFRNSNIEVADETMILTREAGSSIALLAIVLPFAALISGNHKIEAGWVEFGKYFTNAGAFFGMALAGLNLYLSWWAYFFAIRKLGATNATTVNISYVIWAPILGMIFYPMFSYNGWDWPHWSYYVFSVTMVVSIIFTIRNVQRN